MSFATAGYAVAPVFAPEEIAPLRAAVAEHIDRLSRALLLPLHETAPDAAFDRRIEEIAPRDPSFASLLGAAVATDAHRDPRAQALAEDERLTAAAEALLGQPIAGRTVRFRGASSALDQHLQDWHSDVAIVDSGPCASVKLTCWIPLSNAGPDAGGLELATGRRDAPALHDPAPGRFHIRADALASTPKVSPIVPVGSVLFMDRFTPHRALPNRSGKTRWSLVVWMKA